MSYLEKYVIAVVSAAYLDNIIYSDWTAQILQAGCCGAF